LYNRKKEESRYRRKRKDTYFSSANYCKENSPGAARGGREREKKEEKREKGLKKVGKEDGF